MLGTGLIGSVVYDGFRRVAAVRDAPAVHPRGQAFAAELELLELLPQPRYDAVVRLTRGAGLLRDGLDVLGLAIRINHGPWDMLLSSAGTGRLTRWIPHPANDWGSAEYGTLSPYELDGRQFWLRATPVAKVGHASVAELSHRAPTSFTLSTAGRTGGWRPIGRLTLGEPIGDDGERFDPVLHRPPGWILRPNWLRTIRELAYAGSRRGRRNGS